MRLVELTGTDFDFSALNEVDETVREEILEELEPETVAEGVRELESDDAVELPESLDEQEQEQEQCGRWRPRELGSANALRVVLREGLVGLVNGAAFAVVTGVAAWAWFKIPGLGVVIGLPIISNPVAGALLDSDGPGKDAGGPGRGDRDVRHHNHRCGRLFLFPRYRDAVVRPEMGAPGKKAAAYPVLIPSEESSPAPCFDVVSWRERLAGEMRAYR